MQEAHIAPTDGMLHLPPRQRCLAGAFEQSAPRSPVGTKKVRPCGPASLGRLLHRPEGSPLKAPPVKEGFRVVVCIGWRRAADSRADPKIAAGARWPPSSPPGTKKGQTL